VISAHEARLFETVTTTKEWRTSEQLVAAAQVADITARQPCFRFFKSGI
jgi:hypothetical protein